MKKILSKISAIALAVMMIISLCTIQISASVCYVGSESNSFDSLAEAIKKGGDVYLTQDAELDCSEHFFSAKTRIYGNGKTIKLNNTFHVDLNCEMALYDVTLDLNQYSMVVSGAKTVLTIGKGTTVKNGFANNGGAAIMYVNSKIIMEEGALITDCKAQYGGGGIRTHQGTFEMKGGKITNCTGAGVMADAGSTFIVSGDATITGNVKADGTTFNVNLQTPMKITGNLTGRIGVTPKADMGSQIGTIEGNVSGLNNIVSDADSSLVGNASGANVVLAKGGTASSGSSASATTSAPVASNPAE